MVQLSSSWFLTALVLPAFVQAQSFSECNPLKTSSCSPNKALATSFSTDFKEESSWFHAATVKEQVHYTDEGLKLTLAKRFDNPSVKSNFYIMYGKLEVILKASPGTGIVSSFYLQSDDLDEIDLEWTGTDDTQVQTNFFSKGNTTTYDRGKFHQVDSPQSQYHNYTIDWSLDELVWYVDGQVIRTLKNDTTDGYPQSPMYVVLGIWAGGDPDNAPGTIQWSGGETDYTKVPFNMYVERVVVTDYSSGSEYSYTDNSGDWTSIEAKDGSVNGRHDDAEKEFETLVAGGTISSDQSSSESSSSSDSSSSSSDDDESSSSYHDGLSSSRSRVESVTSSHLYTRSESSSNNRNAVSTTSDAATSTEDSSSGNSTTGKSGSAVGSGSNSTNGSSSTHSVVESNGAGVSVNYPQPIGKSGIKAFILSTFIALGIMLFM
ncbi:Xyloglucan endotransglucosylase/hydrolase protein 4 [Wickerhamomyces ciferrii]|uniref:Crh-like protein n=1 Tax=Wickerhamomyces ciferrii (strain ATCC 14091 / BCRC 22168 / CBS 111 / JCM 3599 / NBRC 0793 / NRRL Y-1031 F-60-10) TaxID=1206466 RepID=K0KGA6_WICCF|nr:Xyloglucan endotransglucosylase/hydrolase protein 4 [Wickerhamomyces ciferrii]CCH41217.1 Xyloglucan endotransglucosylase/hydrolase protein 4 [Wickerhamomyces ciferrii]